MTVVDDGLVLRLLLGRTPAALETREEEPALTTGLWFFRLCRAVLGGRSGRLSRQVRSLRPEDEQAMVQRILQPPPQTLRVVGLSDVAATAALLAQAHRLNALSAEALAVAMNEGVPIAVSRGNDGAPLRSAAEAEGITYRVVS